jgi:hypothetical protein
MKQNTKINSKNTKKNTKIKKNTRLRKRTYKKVKNMRKNKKGGGKRGREYEDEDEGEGEGDYSYDYDDSYNNILNKIVFKSETDSQCRTTRSTTDRIIQTVSLGSTNQTSFASNNIVVATPEQLDTFVKTKIGYGPQIVSLQVPPFRHAFLVNVLSDKIMISDWKGNEKLQELQKLKENAKNKRQTRQSNQPPEIPNWNQYYDFMKLLEKRYEYKLPIKFYKVNDDLKIAADTKNKKFDGGGCAEYIYRWVEGILLDDNKNKRDFFSM